MLHDKLNSIIWYEIAPDLWQVALLYWCLGFFFYIGFLSWKVSMDILGEKIETRGKENWSIFKKKLGAQVSNHLFNGKGICFRTSVST